MHSGPGFPLNVITYLPILKRQTRSMKKAFNLIVVDESGSMTSIYQQALMGINETLSTIKTLQDQSETGIEQRVTLLFFDSERCRFVYNNAPINDCRQMTTRDYKPNACTPLYDAIGKGIAKVNAVTTEDDHVLVTIITDGWENASREYTLPMIKNLIEKLKKQNWTFTFIGTDNLDVHGMAADMSIDDFLSFKQDDEGTRAMFAKECQALKRYYKRQEMGFNERSGSFFSEDDDEAPKK